MKRHLRALLTDKEMARDLAENGLQTIRALHTCAHRVGELMSIIRELDAEPVQSSLTENPIFPTHLLKSQSLRYRVKY